MRKRRISTLGPGGNVIALGLGAVLVLFVMWQFVIPFFFNRDNSASASTSNGGNANSNSNTNNGPQIVAAGRVLDASDNSPIAGATVVADNQEVAKVDASGYFTITQKLPDKATINIVAPGYAPIPLDPKKKDTPISLQPVIVTGQLMNGDTNAPIANKLVTYNGLGFTTDADGKFTITRAATGSTIRFNGKGFETVEQPIEAGKTSLTLTTRSTQLTGTLIDKETNQPVRNALLTIGKATATTKEDGKFTFDDAPRNADAVVKVRAPGYKIQTFPVAEAAKGIQLVPFKYQGVYVPGVYAIKPNYDTLFKPYLDMAKAGKINAIVVDVKHDNDGTLWYDSQVPLAKELNLYYKGDNGKFARDQLIDFKKLLDDCHKLGIYVTARYVVFRDPAIANAKPEWALKSKATGKLWKDVNELSWPNQFVPQVGDYNVSLAKELAGMGFDEVQFDYVRFPTDGKLSDIDFGNGLDGKKLYSVDAAGEKLRTGAIETVVKKAYDALKTTDTFLSLDVFGYSLWLADDVQIGQQYNDLIMISDYICPMVYPSHFEAGQEVLGQARPNPGLFPKEIYQQSGVFAAAIEKKLKPVAKYRPWLEDFPRTWGKGMTYPNTPQHLAAQIEGVNAQPGAWGYTLWNAGGSYQDQVLPAVKK